MVVAGTPAKRAGVRVALSAGVMAGAEYIVDLRALLGFILIAAALVLALLAFAADGAVARFLAPPQQKRDWLRALLAALAAIVIGVQLVTRLGYRLPVLHALPPDVLYLYPVAALGAGSLLALFLERRAGIMYGAAAASIILFLVYAGPA